jgi:CheY-like chemotaxis protein
MTTMTMQPQAITILIADDDEDDRAMTTEALNASVPVVDVRCVENGVALMDYLYRRGPFATEKTAPRPALILLDLNMPLKNGKECLREIRLNPEFRCIPVIILTTSREEEDVTMIYEMGGNSFITKPFTFKSLSEKMQMLKQFWLFTSQLPQC